ncbi:hypothetical protein G5I_06106 [Acromyrmex echinatior]|uniref:Uncharacterized protein n=1 Tax=Acromyrmex echinatior TaxID=103372 RepID=F4WK63_ACREC|nr:hypothetical protein G5I_06106 [Acromyrmex echinatior]
MTISHRECSSSLPPLYPFRDIVAGSYKPDDHYNVINFDERIIRGGSRGQGDKQCTSASKLRAMLNAQEEFASGANVVQGGIEFLTTPSTANVQEGVPGRTSAGHDPGRWPILSDFSRLQVDGE